MSVKSTLAYDKFIICSRFNFFFQNINTHFVQQNFLDFSGHRKTDSVICNAGCYLISTITAEQSIQYCVQC